MTVLAHASGAERTVAVAATLVLAAIYLAGAARLRAGPARRRRGAAFGIGVAALLVATTSPLADRTDHWFWAHMVQHLLLIAVAAPALALAGVGTAARAALVGVGGGGLRRTSPAVTWRRGARDREAALLAAAVVAHLLALSAWHLPALYDLAVRSEPVHATEHVSLLATGTVLWMVVLGVGTRLPGPAVAALFATSVGNGVLGALITFAPTPLYESHLASSGGLTPVEDQQLAGVLMWVPGGAVHLAGAAWILSMWLRTAARRRDRHPAVARPVEVRAS